MAVITMGGLNLLP